MADGTETIVWMPPVTPLLTYGKEKQSLEVIEGYYSLLFFMNFLLTIVYYCGRTYYASVSPSKFYCNWCLEKGIGKLL